MFVIVEEEIRINLIEKEDSDLIMKKFPLQSWFDLVRRSII